MLAASGNEVVGTDIKEETVKMLKSGEIPFEEKEMPELYEKAIQNDIVFTTEYQKTDMYIITVPTPYIRSSKKIDPTYVQTRSEEHTSELQSRFDLVCRLLLVKQNSHV